MDSELYQQLYKFEWEQRSALNSAVNIPIVATTVLGGAGATMALSYPYSAVLPGFGFVIAMLGALVCLAYSVYSILRSLITSKYKKTPSPIELRKHFEALSAWHLQNGSTTDAARIEFEDKLNLRLAEATEANATNNNSRAVYIFRATVALFIALVFLAVAAALYVAASVASDGRIHKARIVSPGSLREEAIVATDKPQAEVNTPPSTPQTPPSTPSPAPAATSPKPEFPPNVDVRHYTIVPDKKSK
jgi:hypothetical protein